MAAQLAKEGSSASATKGRCQLAVAHESVATKQDKPCPVPITAAVQSLRAPLKLFDFSITE